jgi:hypothetical protein
MSRTFKFVTFFILTILSVCLVKQTVATASFLPNATLANLLSKVTSTPSQATSPVSPPPDTNFWQSFVIAIVSAFLGFIANLIIEKYKKKREPHKQLSYNKVIKKGIVDIEKDLQQKISILYDNHPAKNMYYILFDLENTGNRTIQAQEIRFEFPDGSQILDCFYDPAKPEAEMKVEELKDPGLSQYERKYRIGYMERGKKLGFRFIVAGSESQDMRMEHYTKNEKDEVDFVSGIVSKTANETETIKDFLMWVLIFIGVPPSLEGLLFAPLGQNIAGLVRLFSLIFILQKVEFFVKAVIDIMSNMESKKGIHIDESQIGNLVIQDESQGSVTIGNNNP